MGQLYGSLPLMVILVAFDGPDASSNYLHGSHPKLLFPKGRDLKRDPYNNLNPVL